MAQTHGNTAGSKLISAPHSRSFSGPFGRMFRILPAWEPKGDTDEEKLKAIADIADEMKGGAPTDNNKTIPAGYTYFGQFVDHDLTFDPRSSLQKKNDPESLEDFRSPAFDLDCLYGRGPDDQPYMYAQDGDPEFPIKGMLRWDKANVFGEADLLRLGPKFTAPPPFDISPTDQSKLSDEDKKRTYLHRAVIGDKRNDENTFVSQLQLIFVKFHNAVLEKLKRDGKATDFSEAQRLVRWHYQWVVIHDWLKLLCGEKFIDDILNGGGYPGKPALRYYKYEKHPFMPVEFSVAAYRLGHSMVRGAYKINGPVPRLPTFAKPADNNLFGDFRGFRPLPPGWTIDWSFFFNFTKANPEPANMQFTSPLDKSLAGPLIDMPRAIADPDEVPVDSPARDALKSSLAYRNLLRSWRLGLPSGQSVAKMIGVTKQTTRMDLTGDTPLWRYILDEAEVDGSKEKLGRVGATIVAETFIGLLAADPSSYYRIDPDWQPDLGDTVAKGMEFKLRDIIKFAGGVIAPQPEVNPPPSTP